MGSDQHILGGISSGILPENFNVTQPTCVVADEGKELVVSPWGG